MSTADDDTSDERPVPSDRSSAGGLSAWTDAVQDMAPYLDLGWRLAAAAAGPPMLGYFLVDFWLGTTPWGVLGGAALGAATAGVQLKQLHRELGE